MYCLDTNIVVDILRGDRELAKRVAKEVEEGDVFLTPVSLCELYRGVFGHSKPEQKEIILNLFISNFSLTSFSDDACRIFGEIYNSLKKKGKTVSEFDLMIASIAKANDLVLVTRDKKHFENLGIRVEVW